MVLGPFEDILQVYVLAVPLEFTGLARDICLYVGESLLVFGQEDLSVCQ